MSGKRVVGLASFVGLVGAALLLVSLSSCAHNQHLESITVSPSTFTFFAPLSPGATPNVVPLTAYGTYIHPPETINITNQVTWSSDQTLVADVSSSGQLTAGVACGVADVSASVFTDGGNPKGPVVVGTMTVTVEGPSSQGCPQGTETTNLSVTVSPMADGNVTSSPPGIDCGATGNTGCAFPFPAGSIVTLTASPVSPHSFLNWSGCTPASATTCNVTLSTNVAVTATFN
jgi:Divergent InlB B-repeat domain